MSEGPRLSSTRLAVLCLLASTVFSSVSRAQAPVFAITPVESSIKFYVKASVALAGCGKTASEAEFPVLISCQ